MNVKEQIEAFSPWNDQEARDRELLLGWLDSGGELFTRENAAAHFTVSSWVVNPERTHVLMAYHNIYNSWAWLGGHADGERDLLKVALKEAREESGICQVTPVTEHPISLEILTVNGHEKKGKYVSCHLHLNLTYLLEAPMDQDLAAKPDENSGVAWIPLEEIGNYSTETWFIRRIYSKLTEKVRNMA